ncbi:MAG: DUF1467 family protein [Alphaproteobacteria bacterium]
MNPVLGGASYFIIWWLVFFALLPVGATSHHEAGEPPPPGSEPGAPLQHGLRKKALWATGIAVVVWLFVYWAVSTDVFHVLSAR